MLRRLLFVVGFALAATVQPQIAIASTNSGAPAVGPNGAAPSPFGGEPLPGYAHSIDYFTISPALSRISQVPSHAVGSKDQTPAELAETAMCQSFYTKFTQRNLVRMHVSFGYYDDSEGEEFSYSGTNYGFNTSMDQEYLVMMRSVLSRRCTGNLQLCGFSEVGSNVFRKSVQNPLDGQQVAFEITLDNSSLTPFYLQNTETRAAEQMAKSNATHEAFLDAVRNDEAVFYFGHARNGGGPDFYPVKLLPNRKPAYRTYYEVVHPGFKDLMAAIHDRGEAPPVLGLFACYSEFWFGRTLLSASPHTGYFFSQSDELTGLDVHMSSGLAAMDSLMRFQCFDGMTDEMAASAVKPGFHENIRNFLTNRSPVDLNAHISSVPD